MPKIKKKSNKVKTQKEIKEKETRLITPNNNGIFQSEINEKGKEVNSLSWDGCKIELPNGKIVSDDVRPKFDGWHELDYLEQLKKDRSVLFLEPMSCHEDVNYVARNLKISDEIAELKMDGHRGLVHMGKESNRVFSRRVSKKTDWYNENSDQVPHIRDMIVPDLAGTVLDGEFDYGTTSMGVQSVMGSLPANAIQFQHNHGFIKFYAFDILYYKGINIQQMKLWKRKIYLMMALSEIYYKYGIDCNFIFTKIYVHPKVQENLINAWGSYADDEIYAMLRERVEQVVDYKVLYEEVLEREQEGLIVKRIFEPYEQKKSKNFIKLKGSSTWDCITIGYTEPTKIYDGKEIESWKYWEAEDGSLLLLEDGEEEANAYAMSMGSALTPVTKPYFMGWCGGIEFGVVMLMDWDNFYSTFDKDDVVDMTRKGLIISKNPEDKEIIFILHVGDCKGLTEAIQIDIKENGEKYVQEKRVIEVLANGIIDKQLGSLRHPRFKQWRDDKGFESCTFDNHIRVVNS